MVVADLEVGEVLFEIVESHEEISVVVQTFMKEEFLQGWVIPSLVLVTPLSIPFVLPPRIPQLNQSDLIRAILLVDLVVSPSNWNYLIH